MSRSNRRSFPRSITPILTFWLLNMASKRSLWYFLLAGAFLMIASTCFGKSLYSILSSVLSLSTILIILSSSAGVRGGVTGALFVHSFPDSKEPAFAKNGWSSKIDAFSTSLSSRYLGDMAGSVRSNIKTARFIMVIAINIAETRCEKNKDRNERTIETPILANMPSNAGGPLTSTGMPFKR